MILLSSYGLCSPIVSEKAKEYIAPENKKVLVVPFAGYNNEQTAAREVSKGLIPFGFTLDNISVLDVNNPELCRGNKIDMIYVPGGNPFKLLSQAKKCNINQWIVDMVAENTIYFGISSGADFACENLEYLKLVDECNFELENYNGLGLIKEKVLCHIDQRDMSTLQRVKDFDERNTIFLRNDEIYVVI